MYPWHMTIELPLSERPGREDLTEVRRSCPTTARPARHGDIQRTSTHRTCTENHPKLASWKKQFIIQSQKSQDFEPAVWIHRGAIATRKPKLDAFKQPASSIPPTLEALEKLVSDRQANWLGITWSNSASAKEKALTWHQCEPWTSLVLAPYTVGQK